MAANVSDLPQGFKLDDELPQGFTLDAPSQPAPPAPKAFDGTIPARVQQLGGMDLQSDAEKGKRYIRQALGGTTESVTGNLIKAAGRAAGAPTPPVEAPKTTGEAVARLSGQLTSGLAEVGAAAAIPGVGPFVAPLLGGYKMVEAAPALLNVARMMTSGASGASVNTALSNLAEGRPVGENVAASAGIGAALPAAMGGTVAGAKAAKKLSPKAIQNHVLELFLGKPLSAIAKESVPGKLATETSPETRAAAAAVLGRDAGQSSLRPNAASRIASRFFALQPGAAARDAAIARRQMLGEAQAAETSAQNADRAAVTARANIGAPQTKEQQGSALQVAMLSHERALRQARDESAAPLLRQAQAQAQAREAAGQFANTDAIVNRIDELDNSLPLSQRGYLAGVRELLTRGGQPAEQGAIVDASGVPLVQRPAVAGANYQDLLQAHHTLTDLIKPRALMEKGMTKFHDRAFAQLDAMVKEAISAHAPAHGEYIDAYREASQPLNRFLDDGFVQSIVDLKDYQSRTRGPIVVNQFEKNPVKAADSLVRESSRGYGKLRDAVGPERAEAFYTAHFSRELQDADARGLRNALRDNADLLNNMPGLRSRIESAASQREAADLAMRQAQARVAELRGLATDADMLATVHRAVETGDVESLTLVRNALRAAGREPNQAIKQMVASTLFKGLEPLVNQADAVTAPSIASSVRGAAGRWNKIRPSLVANRMMTAEHARHVDVVMKDLSEYADGLTKLGTVREAGQKVQTARASAHLAARMAEVALHKIPVIGSIAKGAYWSAEKIASAQRGSVEDLAAQVIVNPELAATLAKPSAKLSDSAVLPVASILGRLAGSPFPETRP